MIFDKKTSLDKEKTNLHDFYVFTKSPDSQDSRIHRSHAILFPSLAPFSAKKSTSQKTARKYWNLSLYD